ncbi:uncharacterized protein BO87DRAFT_125971 [Aspergillus neoniger CBS 115656]|uniref:Uncharacterized protein n=1 Tax=Aspergillus neoniger (strain CBS 115656) TaxID=1448310 RepID=A0A318YAT0_ASPNB|nr:hypothetical protein BO87DRAFT_125971 [Aspergillus neoniger CBS 115656]PYH31456.1 hypothetical protein BO87DRAFT_125971 [Aspergillus neoniger CBS 115656]
MPSWNPSLSPSLSSQHELLLDVRICPATAPPSRVVSPRASGSPGSEGALFWQSLAQIGHCVGMASLHSSGKTCTSTLLSAIVGRSRRGTMLLPFHPRYYLTVILLYGQAQLTSNAGAPFIHPPDSPRVEIFTPAVRITILSGLGTLPIESIRHTLTSDGYHGGQGWAPA